MISNRVINKSISINSILLLIITISSFYGCNHSNGDEKNSYDSTNDIQAKLINVLNISKTLTEIEARNSLSTISSILINHDVQLNLNNSSKTKLEKILNDYYTNLNLDFGYSVESISAFNENLKPIVSFGHNPTPIKMLNINKLESNPANWDVFCDDECKIYAAYPFYKKDKIKGVITIGSNYMNVLKNLRKIFGSNHHFTVFLANKELPYKSNRTIEGWNGTIASSTHSKISMKILTQASKITSLKTLSNKQYEIDDKEFGLFKVYGTPLYFKGSISYLIIIEQ